MSEENKSKSFDGRQMPADVEAERCLLGGILRDPEVMGTAVMAISDDDFFYMERHQLIWNALCSLNKAVTPIDPVTLSAELTKMGKLDIVGGREYIFELMESVASSANVPWQLEHLRSKAVLRKLIRTSSDIIRQAMDPASTPDNVLQDAERDIFAIADNQVRNTLKSIDNFVAPLLERINNRREGGITGVPTGITELDELTNGLQNSDLIILAARPGVGKTSFAMTVAANAASSERVLVNNNIAKPSKDVKIGDIITIEYFKRKLVVRVLDVKENVKAQDADKMYEVLEMNSSDD